MLLLALSVVGCQSAVDRQAAELFEAKLGNTSITVFATYVRDGETPTYDPASAGEIGDLLANDGVATVTQDASEVPITSEWGMNEARMFQESLANFTAYLGEHPLTTEYGLLAEYLIGGQGVPVGVHIYVVDGEGRCAYGTGVNSHHDAFNSVNPQNVADCTTIALNVLNDDLVAKLAAKPAAAAGNLGPDTSVTVLPIAMAGNASKDVADVVGLILERDGMPNVWTTATTYAPAAEAVWEDVITGFGEFIVANPIDTDVAVYGQYLGKPGVGVDEVRAVIVDRAGNVLWSDRQTPDDADFQRINPRNPMTCCMLLGERLHTPFGLSSATAGRVGEGRMARLWKEKSGTPTDEEQSAIRARQQTMKAARATTTLSVYPVLAGPEPNRAQAENLAGLLATDLSMTTVVADRDVRLQVPPNSNEQRRLWDLARAFQAEVRENPPAGDYALYAEYVIRTSDQKVWSVHFVVCDKAGELVVVDFQNEYQPDFVALRPRTVEDCNKLVAVRLAHCLE
jgi:hypothetical protein